MALEITAIFCQCADFLISVGHRDDSQCEMNVSGSYDDRSDSGCFSCRLIPLI